MYPVETKRYTLPSDVSPHHQVEAILPKLFAAINKPRTRELIPEIRESVNERTKRAISLLRKLAVSDADMREQRQWSLEYYTACLEGKRREFLIEEGVFYGGEFLYRPERVKPGMEFVNLNPDNYPEPLKTEAREITELMFLEYFGVKNLISFPDPDDIRAWAQTFPLGKLILRNPLTPPHLKESLLLKDYVDLLTSEANGNHDPYAIFGPGKGEELVRIVKGGNSAICFDLHSFETLEKMFKKTFDQARIKPPNFIQIGDGRGVDASYLRSWKQNGCKPTIFIYSEIDFSKRDAIPDELVEVSFVAGSIYTLHEIPFALKDILFQNMARVSRGSIVVVDGNPTPDALDNIILPRSKEFPITGGDAVITHLLCSTPKEVAEIAKKALPSLEREVKVIGPPIPKPFFDQLQVAAILRRKSKSFAGRTLFNG